MTFEHIHPFLTPDGEDAYGISDISAEWEKKNWCMSLPLFSSES